ncbi:hypothetical protein [Bizionia sp. M204]|uniref:hypothetical protein n=1 Tax=Bizionia sp. M204 TaxID=2675331 RepID=UPI00204C87F4|nr:hypothetical protein [Bizionia sp. M204]UPS90864.1 hypothetical protein GMA17_03655 [Bizionia sp. M204]
MKYIKILLLFITIYSCKTDSRPELKFESSYGMYSILINEFVDASFHLEKEIQEQINSLNINDTLNSDLVAYENLTKEYITYLDNLTDQLIDNSNNGNIHENQQTLTEIQQVNNLFFKDGEYSVKGDEFVEKTDSYRELILKFIKNQNLSVRVKNNLDTRDIIDRNRNSIKTLDYFFKDQSLIGTIAYLKNRKKNVLEFEKEFLNNNKRNK